MKKILFVFSIFVLCSSTFSQVFETGIGKVEIIGLKKWQAKTLLDSVHSLYPNTPLHGCVAELKKDFGFVEVSSIAYPMGNRKFYNVVTIVEDNSQGKIQYLPKQNDSLDILPEYFKMDS
jgi:hypothetical protein